jgi:hypothetical protein
MATPALRSGEWRSIGLVSSPSLNVAANRHDELLAKGDNAVTVFKNWVQNEASGELPQEPGESAPRLADVPQELLEYVGTRVPGSGTAPVRG